jgi:ABC-type polar amino acid transport system ATPase subunit
VGARVTASDQRPAKDPAFAAVDVRGLRKSFGRNEVLKGIDLTVWPGEVAVIIGPSGGGKSTLLRCINFLETPDAGTVLRHGSPFGAWRDSSGRAVRQSSKEINRGRALMPMVFQRFNLFQHLTVLDNVVVGQRVVLGRPRSESEQMAISVLNSVGLGEKLRSYPATLSGGQQQRVGIARALAMEPDVLLLDEPTSSLDPELIGEVLQIIRTLAADGMTMIIATHEMGLARQIASHVHFIDDGLIAEEGSAVEIFESPKNQRTRDFLKAVLN